MAKRTLIGFLLGRTPGPYVCTHLEAILLGVALVGGPWAINYLIWVFWHG